MAATLVVWFIAINIITFAAYGIDNARARRRARRVSEGTLLALGFCGGSPAAYIAQRTLHHKMHNTHFQHQFIMSVMLQVLILAALLVVSGLGEFSWYNMFRGSPAALL